MEQGNGVGGQSQSVVVTITDDRAVDSATLHYRFEESGDFIAQPMKQTKTNRYEATVLPDDKTAESFQYYIEAVDTSGNITFRGYTFNPKTWPLTPASESQASSEVRSNSVVSATAIDGAETAQAGESNPPANIKSGNRTLYTVLGVLAAAVVVGAVANNLGDDGNQEQKCEASGCLVTVTATEP